MQSLFHQNKWLIFIALNSSLALVLIVGAGIGGGSLAELPYVVVLFAICSSPIPYVDRWNGAYAMLSVAMAAYFLEFGLLNAVSMLSPAALEHPSETLIDGGEAILLLGALMQMLGFHMGARLGRTTAGGVAAKDWPRSLLLPMGLMFWCAGSTASLYQSLVLQVDNSNAAIAAGFSRIGEWGTSGLILIANYAGPLGIVILSYWWARWARRGGTVLMLGLIAVQFVVGWVTDTKEIAVSAPAVMILTRFVVTGRVPMRWLICSMLGIVLIFPVLTAKRIITTEGLGLTRAQALPRSVEILARAIRERNVAQKGKYEQTTQTFLQRVTDKAAVEVFVAHIGVDHPYKGGSTLEPMLYALVPRLLWSAKPGENSAQTFNREFHMSADPDTHISPTHIGEFYWNFGILGVLLGMVLGGILLGLVCARFDPSIQSSMTRTLVIIVTLYDLVARGGGQIELDYVVWIRTMLLIGLLHLLFAKFLGSRAPMNSRVALETERLAPPPLRFPNLLH